MSLVTRDHAKRLRESIENYFTMLAMSPVLLGLGLGVWVAGLAFLTDGDPIIVFALMFPVTLVVQYSLKFAAESVFDDSASISSLDRLKQRYAEGDITHTEFEQRADRLMTLKTGVSSGDDRAHRPSAYESAKEHTEEVTESN